MTSICLPSPPLKVSVFFESLLDLSNQCGAFFLPEAFISVVDLDMLGRLLDDQVLLPYCINLLSPQEQTFFSRFKYNKRRQEWLGGRLAAKYSLLRLYGHPQVTLNFMHSLTILPDDFGAPVVHGTGDDHFPSAVSISHSHQYAVAVACPQRCCGVDIQKKSSQLLRVQDRYVAAEEITLFKRIEDNITTLTLIWVAKEAVKKSMLREQPTMFTGIQLTDAHCCPNNRWTVSCRFSHSSSQKTKVYLMEWDNYILGYTQGVHDA